MKKVEVVQNFPKVELMGRKLGPFKEGEEVELRTWEASVLEENGFVKPLNEISSTYLRKILIREEKSSQLEDLPSSFYQKVSDKVNKLRREGNTEKAEELMDAVNSLVDFRVRKLARMIISSAKPENVLMEEQFLVSLLSRVLNLWRGRLDYLFEKNLDKEAGTYERKIGWGIQGIVGKPTDI